MKTIQMIELQRELIRRARKFGYNNVSVLKTLKDLSHTDRQNFLLNEIESRIMESGQRVGFKR